MIGDTVAKQVPAEATSCFQQGPSRLCPAQEFHLILPSEASLQATSPCRTNSTLSEPPSG